MCVATAAIAAASALSKQAARKQQLQAQIEANNKTAQGYIQSMNYSFQNYETERRAAFAQQIESMTKDRLNAHRQEAGVKAAVNEDFAGGGRTAGLINRAVRADESRVASQSKANFERKMNEIDLNKEASLINTKNAINSIAAVETPSYFTQAMELFSDYLGVKNGLDNISSMRKKAGVEGGSTGKFKSTEGVRQVDLDPYIRDEDTRDTGITVRGVDLDEAAAKYDGVSSTNMFNPIGLFAQNPISGYFSYQYSNKTNLKRW